MLYVRIYLYTVVISAGSRVLFLINQLRWISSFSIFHQMGSNYYYYAGC